MDELRKYKLERALRYRARIKQAQEKGDTEALVFLSKKLEEIEQDLCLTAIQDPLEQLKNDS